MVERRKFVSGGALGQVRCVEDLMCSEQIQQDASEVLGQFGLASNNGRGYRVADNPNPMLAAIGAKPGDVILSVNGRSLGDPNQDVALIEQVMQDGTVRVSMERNGRQFDSEYALPGL